MPRKIQFSNGNKAEYFYDATGVKYKAQWGYAATPQNIPLGATGTEYQSPTGVSRTEYCGNYVYENGNLRRIVTPEGYVVTNNNVSETVIKLTWYHRYLLKDHLGNTRSALHSKTFYYTSTALTPGSHPIDYYPFGLEITRVSNPDSEYYHASYLAGATTPYLYNGKEIDRMHGLNWYDYGARYYDGATGRWHGVDPLAEEYYWISPYAYCVNNPVRYIDPDGRDWVDKVAGVIIGAVTNSIPGTSGLRETYTSNDAGDYNNTLRTVDGVSIAVGAGMMTGGGAGVGAGTSIVIAGGVTASTVVGVPEGAAIAAGGAVVVTGSEVLIAGGAMLTANAAANASKGYNYGNTTGSKSVNKLKPNSEATGDHSSFKTDSKGKITNTATYKQNPKNPSGFDEVKRVDVTGKKDNGVNTPHVHEPKQRVRPAKPDELPRQK